MINFEVLDASETNTKTHATKNHACHATNPPAGPLKNYHKGYLADPNGLRDTPLVPKGTVADF